MPDTCWIKDEHGRFQGRRPGCKMEKAGVMEISDNKTTVDGAASEANLEKEAKASGKSVEDYKKEKRALEILKKPRSQWTEEEKAFMKDYDTLEANPTGNPVDAAVVASLGTVAAIVKSILGNIALDVSLDALTKYAEEKFPGYAPGVGIALAALALGVVRGKSPEEIAKAGETIKKAMLDGKMRSKLGEMFDDIATKGYYSKPEELKKITKSITGDLSAEQAEKLNRLAKRAGSSTTFDGYKTEATYEKLEHSIMGHGPDDVKKGISQERAAQGETVRPKHSLPESQRPDLLQQGKTNVALTKEDYQNIPKYRDEAIKSGNVKFQPITADKASESVEYIVPQRDGVIHMIYRIDPANKKMTFVTMWKEGY
ncbi:MAG: hypothetical protein HQK96_09655 [Nitrospirae bacterium]|nr:hypothetical protein [Nitrospirota bacterium]